MPILLSSYSYFVVLAFPLHFQCPIPLPHIHPIHINPCHYAHHLRQARPHSLADEYWLCLLVRVLIDNIGAELIEIATHDTRTGLGNEANYDV
jgi:hypothetical protein